MDQVTQDQQDVKPSKEDLDAMISSILSRFDAKSMESIMQLLQWEWIQPDPQNPDALCMAVPNSDRIKLIAHQLLLSAITHGRASSGGLEATYSNGVMELKFVPVSYSTETHQ